MAHHARLGLHTGDRLEHRFCRPEWRRSRRAVPLATLVEQAAAIDPSTCRRLTFADAPLAHPDLETLIGACRARGLGHFALETDGRPLARPGAVEALVELGVEQIFVVCGGMRKRVYETVMQDDGFVEALEGIRRVAASPIELYVVAPVLQWTAADLVPLLEYVLAMDGRLEGFLPFLPSASGVPPALRGALIPYAAQAELVARVFSICQRQRVEYGFFGKRGVWPCGAAGALDRFGTTFFEHLDVLKHEAHGDSRLVRVAACATCSLAPACPGVEAAYVEHFGEEALAPVPLEVSMDWKLKRIHRLEARDFKSVSAFDNDTEHAGRSLIRVNGHCNMSCAFCFIDRTVPDLAADELLRAIDTLAERNLDHLVLSGGEPTLHPDLPALVAHAKGLGFRTIEIQTNGVRSAEADYAKRLADAGVNKITISLHSIDPETSDKITRLPGAFGKTLRALHNFRALGVETQIAHVITKANFEALPTTVRFLREEFPASGGELSICFGVAQPISDLVYTWVMPRFDEIKPRMRAALDYCLEHDVGFGGMIGQGGYPPCMLDGDLRYYAHNLGNIYRSGDADEQFHKPERCRACSFDPWCLGVRRDYVATYGDEEIRPFTAEVPAPPVGPTPRVPSPDETLVQLGKRPR
jgi:MoaA/NifB/PqqE/SkfB family radical SAM enzyme